MVRIPILGSSFQGEDELDALKGYYSQWRKTNTAMRSPFFQLYRSFKDKGKLRDLDDGALKLYLYFGFVTGNDNGASWHSIDTIADYFGKQTRTIDNWIHSLTEAGLIYRTRDGNKSHTTFLIPYTDAIVSLQPTNKHSSDDQELLDDLVAKIQKLSAVYGQITDVFHIFHWGWDKRSKKPSEKAEQADFLLIITKREDGEEGVMIGHRHQLRHSSENGVNQLNIDEVATFTSPFQFNGQSVKGLAVSHTYRLISKDSIGTWMDLLRDSTKFTDDHMMLHPKVQYGMIKDFEYEDEEADLEEDIEADQEGGEDEDV
ncbi:hypothetical protein PghCCS26_62650 [Paenibacillus glycanilyticus]|uniref:Uncharacterized protein n=1 Tax=Paenibacillus glycanilyticus TaxID=126569 RepID=A0ABQ6NX40_9BACL|nr:helix-turn-helix domain-containing protein [Paenibacillus glycanilyticus]GMK49135.1 hypothetical protein PghCCS26_62650 [Paenibacillus glycanilyticus]